jgi:hypothetical protein
VPLPVADGESFAAFRDRIAAGIQPVPLRAGGRFHPVRAARGVAAVATAPGARPTLEEWGAALDRAG